MAPEQFRGQASPASDLYALGATLLALLSGALFHILHLNSKFKRQVRVHLLSTLPETACLTAAFPPL